MANSSTIRRPGADEADALGRLIADEFHHLPVAELLSADPAVRRLGMAGQFSMLAGHAIAYGDVHVVDGPPGEPIGVAVWMRPGEIPDIDGYDERLAAVCGPAVARFVELDALMHDRHPMEPDHAYLAFLAVRKERQSQGIGSTLIAAYTAGLDGARIPAYVEASSLRSRALYARHGFADFGEAYGLDGGEHFYPMWRDPR